MLSTVALGKSYDGTAILQDVSVTFPSPGTSFVLGPNGSGKTTLIKCLLGLERHTGSVTWGGSPIDPDDNVFFPVFDDCPFYDRLSGRKNLRMFDITGTGALEMASAYLSEKDLRRPVRKYSQGQRKKLALTAAFASGAACLFLDEPTNGLDQPGLARLSHDIRRVGGERTVVLTGHQLDFYDGLIDNLFVFRDSRLTEVGVPSASGRLASRGGLSDVYQKYFPIIPD